MKPGSPEWARLVTASKVAAILGLSPWDSPRTMWLKMRGDLPSDDGANADAKSRGHYLEAGVVQWWRDRHNLSGEDLVFEPVEQAHLELWDTSSDHQWGAATPDLIGGDDGHGNAFVMDAKTAASADDWGTPGTDEAPAYYVAQAMWQLACQPTASVAYIAVLFGRPQLEFAEYVIERDDDLIASIVLRCKAFHDSLPDDDAAPDLSDHIAEYDAIRKVHADIDREAVAVIPDDLAARYLTDLAHAERADATKARVLDLMGNARLAKTESGLFLARRQPKGQAVTLVRTAALPALEPMEEAS